MTLKERISQELLDSIGDPVVLEEVLKRHSRSKGPLYLGLAQATTELCERLAFAFSEIGDAEEQRQSLAAQLEALSKQKQGLQMAVQELTEQIDAGESRLEESRGLLDRADELADSGFGEAELQRLIELLAELAAAEGASLREGINQFFATVAGHKKAFSLDLVTKRAEVKLALAKAEVERWEAEARSREAKTKARVSAIDVVE